MRDDLDENFFFCVCFWLTFVENSRCVDLSGCVSNVFFESDMEVMRVLFLQRFPEIHIICIFQLY